MSQLERNYVVVRHSFELDNRLALADDIPRLVENRMGSRVALRVGKEGPFAVIRFGIAEYRVSDETIAPARNVKYAVGDTVTFKGGIAAVVDVKWHWKREEPIYFLEFNGKRLSKRYFNSDLEEKKGGVGQL